MIQKCEFFGTNYLFVFLRYCFFWVLNGPPKPHPRRQCQRSLPGEKHMEKYVFYWFHEFYVFFLKICTKMITSCSIRRVAFVVMKKYILENKSIITSTYTTIDK